jgi:hypothetical protein
LIVRLRCVDFVEKVRVVLFGPSKRRHDREMRGQGDCRHYIRNNRVKRWTRRDRQILSSPMLLKPIQLVIQGLDEVNCVVGREQTVVESDPYQAILRSKEVGK